METCTDCKWFSEESNGFCEYYAKFVDTRPRTFECEHHEEEKELRWI